MEETKLYVDKARYDLLFWRFMCLKREHKELKARDCRVEYAVSRLYDIPIMEV